MQEIKRTKLLTSAEVCALLKIDRSTLSRWVDAGHIEVQERMPGKTGGFLFTREQVETARLAAMRRSYRPQPGDPYVES